MNGFRTSLLLLLMALVLVAGAPASVAADGGPSAANSSEEPGTFTVEMGVVLALIVVLIGLFIWEPVRLDIIALSIPVVLMVLEPWTLVSPEEGLSGFSSTATITVLAMFVLSEGIRRTGLVQVMGDKIAEFTMGSENRQFAFVSGLSGLSAGIINNTPIVAIFIPMVTNLARKAKTSPSKLLLPLSYASMLGGTLTLLGTSTNLLASDISAELLNHPFSMFEFTKLGVLVLVAGYVYLLTLGRYLVPARIDPEEELTEEYEMEEFLTEVVVESGSPMVGRSVPDLFEEVGLDFDVVQVIRDGEQFMEPLDVKTIREGDHLLIRADRSALLDVLQTEGLRFLPNIQMDETKIEEPTKGQSLIEVVVPNGSFLEGETLNHVNFLDRYDATVLAVRRGGELTHSRMDEFEINAGDILLLLSTERTLDRLRNNRNFIITQQMEASDYRRSKTWLAVGLLAAVVGVAAVGLLPIVASALAGVIGMIITGCVRPNEVYEAIDWEVIFLLAGLIPLGLSMQQTGTAQWLATGLMSLTGQFPVVVVLGMFYLFTALLTNIISNNASVVLMIPVAVDAAQQIGANPFAFVLAVTFAASTAFMTPVGYQTNLMVYSSGGYKFRDFIVVGAPLQLLLTIVTPLGIAYFWGV